MSSNPNLIQTMIEQDMVLHTIIAKDGILYISKNGHWAYDGFPGTENKIGLIRAVILCRNKEDNLISGISNTLNEMNNLDRVLGCFRRIQKLNDHMRFLEPIKKNGNILL